MKHRLVRYKTKPETAEENQRLIEAVFSELKATSREGVRYLALRLDDDTFLHFVTMDGVDPANPMAGVEAFQMFQSGIRERCVEPPRSAEATIVGNYRVLGE